MQATRFDRLARELITGSSRRDLLRGLGGTAAGLAALQFPQWADARNKHDADNKRKRKGKHKKRENRTKPIPTSPPSPPVPVTKVDASCLAQPPLGEQTGPRLAQTFVAKRSGQLTSAMVMLFGNEEGADFVLEIRDVDVGGTPTNVVLGSTVVTNVPVTIPGELRSIVGDFDSPATVVAGEVYALVVTETTGLNHSFYINGTNPCLDGILFRDKFVDGTFDPRSNQDLAYTTFVTA